MVQQASSEVLTLVENLNGKVEIEQGEIVALNLSGTNVSDEDLKPLKDLDRLRVLRLNGTKISDNALSSLRQLKDLKVLNLKNTRVTRIGVIELNNFLPNTRIITE